jgi:hypothetical protein
LQFAGLNTVQNTEIFGNAAQYVWCWFGHSKV